MNINISEWIWLNDNDVCTASHLVEVSGLSNDELDELIRIGVIAPVDGSADVKFFQLRHLVTANTARRLRDDFELDLQGMALAMTLMRRIEDLQRELNNMHARLPIPIDGH